MNKNSLLYVNNYYVQFTFEIKYIFISTCVLYFLYFNLIITSHNRAPNNTSCSNRFYGTTSPNSYKRFNSKCSHKIQVNTNAPQIEPNAATVTEHRIKQYTIFGPKNNTQQQIHHNRLVLQLTSSNKMITFYSAQAKHQKSIQHLIFFKSSK